MHGYHLPYLLPSSEDFQDLPKLSKISRLPDLRDRFSSVVKAITKAASKKRCSLHHTDSDCGSVPLLGITLSAAELTGVTLRISKPPLNSRPFPQNSQYAHQPTCFHSWICIVYKKSGSATINTDKDVCLRSSEQPACPGTEINEQPHRRDMITSSFLRCSSYEFVGCFAPASQLFRGPIFTLTSVTANVFAKSCARLKFLAQSFSNASTCRQRYSSGILFRWK